MRTAAFATYAFSMGVLREKIQEALAHNPDALVNRTAHSESWLNRIADSEVKVKSSLLRGRLKRAYEAVLKGPEHPSAFKPNGFAEQQP